MSLAALLRRSGKRLLWGCCLSSGYLAAGSNLMAASPSAEQALGLQPVQKDVEYDRPAADAVGKCTIAVEKAGSASGWIVKDQEGRTLRRFIDTNGDNTVDQWSYFADGLEVYRDVDSNANGKADQFRWLNTGGSRWALDTNEDGKVDTWKSISAEEVSAEAVQAMANRDEARFKRLLLTADELKALGVGDKFGTVISDKITAASQRFSGLVSDSKISNVATSSTKWLNFSGTRPGLVPAGTDGTTKDVLVYENVAAMMEVGEKTAQVQIGTMIRVGDVWRLVDAPKVVGDADQLADNAIFFNAPTTAIPPDDKDNKENREGGEIFKQLEDIEGKLAKASGKAEITAIKKQRADLIEKILPNLKEEEDRVVWTRQLVDSLSEGVQSDTNPEFVTRLKDLEKKLTDEGKKDLVPYVRFSLMTAEYVKAQSDGTDFVKVQTKWLDDLKQFVKDFPKAPESADALLHLAIDAEYAGQEDASKNLYTLITTQFPQSATAQKAAGSLRRLQSIGKALTLRGTTADGKPFDVASLAGKPVIVYYFASNGATAAGEIAVIKQVQAKYARDVAVIGVSLDHSPEELTAFLQQNRLSWPTLFDAKAPGMDGRFANEMGILTIPTILLLDGKSQVVNRGLHISELDREVGNVVKNVAKR